jgi:serine/threonine protein kinase
LSNIEPTPFGDKYVLVEHIATGGMAEVYRAQYTGIEGFAKELVVKCLREEFLERDDVITMFLDEARVAATLSHNNVVHTYDLGEVGGEYFIAMEYLKGEELVAVLRRSIGAGIAVPLDIGLGIIMQSLEGLQYAHSRTAEDGSPLGLVHRDINPTNIHVGYDGLCKIVDFGIAATRSSAVVKSGQFAGKLSYMGPEQVRGDALDGRADIFALGVVLYEMVLRRRLFRGAPEEVRERILTGDVPPPTFVDPNFPPGLEAIIMRALEVDASERYQNADHMFRDLDAFMNESGMTCTPRKISAFMSEMFGEGAPAEVDYDGQYDDLVDDALDFDALDGLGDEDDDDEPEWARELEGPKGGNPRRSMTIGNLDALVADVASGDSGTHPAAGSGARKITTGARPVTAKRVGSGGKQKKARPGSAAHPRVRGGSRSPTGARRRPNTTGGRPAVTGSRPRATASRPRAKTINTGALETPMAGDAFGQSVMMQQTKGTNPLVYFAVVVIFGAIAYFAWTIMSAK